MKNLEDCFFSPSPRNPDESVHTKTGAEADCFKAIFLDRIRVDFACVHRRKLGGDRGANATPMFPGGWHWGGIGVACHGNISEDFQLV